jgi:tripartite-type tricarboxylate transporter receptor subunit TctC
MSIFRNRRRTILRVALAAPSLYLGVLPSAQSRGWPEKPIKLVLGYPAGGAADGLARQLQVKLESQLGQPLVFDYRPGATGAIAADFVAHAAPDGYTLHFAESAAFSIVPSARKLNYDPLSNFTLIGSVASGGVVLAAHPDVHADNVPQLISMLRAKPGEMAFGTAGIASFGHLAAELFQAKSQTAMTHVPYKGGAQAMIGLVGGQVPLLFASIGTAVPYIESGKIKALGVTSAKRSAALPTIPTVGEQGLGDAEVSMWFALVGPAKLPADVVSRLHGALTETIADTAVQTAIKHQGYEPALSSAQQLHDRIQTDLAKWGKLIRDRKLTLD